ncbi:MAG TPA: nuclear transport factor 2 family protein [Gemmatimonadota bacterium]|nr:nuclear transport factor 2 family protein [Gemmatimonadota bacterium]
MKSKLLPLYLVVMAFPAIALGQDTKAAIEAGSQAWQEAWTAGDAAGVTALYAKDAIVLAPGAEPVTGHEAIQAFWQASIDERSGDTEKITTLEVHAMGDMAVEVGSYANTGPDAQHNDHGKFIAVWKKVDGEWKIARDIFNSSM